MKKQNYILSTICTLTLALIVAGCSSPSVETAANVSNQTNANVPMTNANATNSNDLNGAPTPAAR